MSFSPKQLAHTLPKNSQILSELKQIQVALDWGLRKILANPQLRKSKIEEILTLFLNLSDETKKFITFLVKEKSLNNLPKILRAYEEILRAEKIVQTAELVTAFPLGDEDLKKAEEKLSVKLGMPVKIKTIVDKNILGGAILKVQDQTVDNSLKTRLGAIK